jgi:hypothetical protein
LGDKVAVFRRVAGDTDDGDGFRFPQELLNFFVRRVDRRNFRHLAHLPSGVNYADLSPSPSPNHWATRRSNDHSPHC